MASVAICPFCDAQLIIPAGVTADARVSCPTCHEEFDLRQAARRPAAEIKVIERPPARSAATVADVQTPIPSGDLAGVALPEPAADRNQPMDTAQLADEDFATWFRANKTVAEVPPASDAEAKTPAAADASAATEQSEELPPGPTFDLPNVPLTHANRATVEVGAASQLSAGGRTDFELEDVDFNLRHARTVDEFAAVPALASGAPSGADNHPAKRPDPRVAAPVIAPIPRGRRRRPVLRSVLAAAVAGPVGLAIGYYILMHLVGPAGDFLELAEYVPSAMLPDSFEPAPVRVADEQSASRLLDHVSELETGRESTNVAAGYLERSEPAIPDRPLQNDATVDQPEPFEEPAAAALASVTPRVLGAPTYTLEQLSAALGDAQQAQSGLMTGDLSDQSVRRTKGLSYAKLCDLAQVLTFLDESTPAEEIGQMPDDADELFRQTLADAHTRDEVARIAAIWIDSPHRRHGGVFLAGSIRGGQIAGDVYEYQLNTENGPAPTILLRRPLESRSDAAANLVIVGAIVDQPTEKLPGYAGDARQVIWASRAIPLD